MDLVALTAEASDPPSGLVVEGQSGMTVAISASFGSAPPASEHFTLLALETHDEGVLVHSQQVDGHIEQAFFSGEMVVRDDQGGSYKWAGCYGMDPLSGYRVDDFWPKVSPGAVRLVLSFEGREVAFDLLEQTFITDAH